MFGCLGLLQDPASAAENFGKAPGTARLIFTPLTPHITHISHATSPITALKAGSFFFSMAIDELYSLQKRVQTRSLSQNDAPKACGAVIALSSQAAVIVHSRELVPRVLFTCRPDTLIRHVSNLRSKFLTCSVDKRRLPAQMRFTRRCTTISCFTSAIQILCHA
jgi:hypothetical protein